jgi:nucleoside-diphosphate-sugar epimerase
VFITGGFGYIGTAFAKEAAKKGYNIVLYDSLIYEQNYKKIMKDVLSKRSKRGSVELIIGDIRNTNLLEKSIKEFQPDYVIHLAELVGIYACDHNPLYTKDINYDASKKVIDLCENLDIPILYNSTSSIYGNQKDARLMTEKDAVPKPTDNYCKYKLLIEKYIEGKKGKNKDFKVIVFRPATVCGISPRMRIDLLPNHFTYCAVAKNIIKISEVDAFRTVISIQDIVKAYFKVINKKSWKKLIYNLGNHNLTKKQFAYGIKSVVDCKIIDIPNIGDIRNLQIDCSLFNNEFNFKPNISYKKAVIEIAKWIKTNKSMIEKNNFAGILNMSPEQWSKII